MELDIQIPARDCRRHPELAEQVRQAVKETADLVRECSQMPLGGRLVVRLVSRRGFARYCRRYDREFIMAGVRTDEHVSAAQLRTLRLFKRLVNVPTLALVRRVVPAQTLADGGDGSPMITLVPANITQRQISERELVALVAHELAHVAQFAVARDHQPRLMARMLRAIGEKLPPSERPAHMLLFEGHATWVHLQVTEQLYGEPIRHRPPGGETFRGRVNHRIARLSPAAKDRDKYNHAAEFSGHVIEQHGHDVMRRVIAEPDLWPTAAEITDPATWTRRLFPDAAAPELGGPRP